MGSVKIGIGFGLFRLGLPSPAEICALAERAEEVGIDSVWLSDHLVSRNPHLEIASVMAMMAARTGRLKMGPAVLTLPARHPVEVARTYATLDYLSGGSGRIIMAVGLGSDPRDAAVAGVPKAERAPRMEEGVAILRKLWAGAHVTHHGHFWSFEDVTIEPRPARGKLDVWIGGRTDAAIRRTARYGDGWFPSFVLPSEFREGVGKMVAWGAEVGRELDPDEAGVVLLCHLSRDRTRGEDVARRFFEGFPAPPETLAERSAIGGPDEVIARVREYVEAGCRKFVLWPIGAPGDLVPQIEAYGREILPAFTSA